MACKFCGSAPTPAEGTITINKQRSVQRRTTEKFLRALESTARLALNKESARLQDKGVPVGTVLDAGVPWEQIVEISKSLDAGVVVMGTRGRRGLPRAILGSVAEKVVRVSSIPVLTVHEPPSGD